MQKVKIIPIKVILPKVNEVTGIGVGRQLKHLFYHQTSLLGLNQKTEFEVRKIMVKGVLFMRPRLL